MTFTNMKATYALTGSINNLKEKPWNMQQHENGGRKVDISIIANVSVRRVKYLTALVTFGRE